MTIAVTPFEGLCGFRPLAEIIHFLKAVNPVRELVGTEAAETFERDVILQVNPEEPEAPETIEKNKTALRTVFTSLMTSTPEAITTATHKLVLSAQNSPDTFGVLPESIHNPSSPSDLAELVVRLNDQFPNDIGLFVLFFLNYVKLTPGEAMFLKADDIHAYISGDIIECMASSDNVVRAGFTPKFKDVKTLTDMLTYSYSPIEEQKMTPTEYPYATLNLTSYTSHSTITLYDPPIEEFSVIKTDLKTAGAKATFEPINGPSIIICTGGVGTLKIGPAKTEEAREGYVFFVGADAELTVESSSEVPFTTFKAFCELDRHEHSVNGSH